MGIDCYSVVSILCMVLPFSPSIISKDNVLLLWDLAYLVVIWEDLVFMFYLIFKSFIQAPFRLHVLLQVLECRDLYDSLKGGNLILLWESIASAG